MGVEDVVENAHVEERKVKEEEEKGNVQRKNVEDAVENNLDKF